MSGALCLISPGTPLQSLTATLLVLFYLLFILKLAPYQKATEDWTSLIGTLTLLLTTLSGFALHALIDENEIENATESDANKSHIFGLILLTLAIGCLVVDLLIVGLFDLGIYDKLRGNQMKTDTKVIPTRIQEEEEREKNTGVSTWTGK